MFHALKIAIASTEALLDSMEATQMTALQNVNSNRDYIMACNQACHAARNLIVALKALIKFY
jgi:hypothetical protein